MRTNSETPYARLEDLRATLNARAAGWWRVSEDRQALEQVAFAAADDMPGDVAEGFAEATRLVSLSATELGIVKAATSRQVAVSVVGDLPADRGSGLWLRRFGADQSAAVPVCDARGTVIGIVSLAAAVSPSIADSWCEWVAKRILETALSWPEFMVTGLDDSPTRL